MSMPDPKQPGGDVGVGIALGEIKAEVRQVRERLESVAHGLTTRISHVEEKVDRAHARAAAAQVSVNDHADEAAATNAAVVAHIQRLELNSVTRDDLAKIESSVRSVSQTNAAQTLSIAAVSAETEQQTPLIRRSPRAAAAASFIAVVLAEFVRWFVQHWFQP